MIFDHDEVSGPKLNGHVVFVWKQIPLEYCLSCSGFLDPLRQRLSDRPFVFRQYPSPRSWRRVTQQQFRRRLSNGRVLSRPQAIQGLVKVILPLSRGFIRQLEPKDFLEFLDSSLNWVRLLVVNRRV